MKQHRHRALAVLLTLFLLITGCSAAPSGGRAESAASPTGAPGTEVSALAPSADAAVLENGQTYELMLSGPHSEDPGQEVTYLLVSE